MGLQHQSPAANPAQSTGRSGAPKWQNAAWFRSKAINLSSQRLLYTWTRFAERFAKVQQRGSEQMLKPGVLCLFFGREGYCKVHVHLQEVSYLLWESSADSKVVQRADQEHELSFLLVNSLSKTFRGVLCLELLLWQLHWQKRSFVKYTQKACHRSLGRETVFSAVQLHCTWPKLHKGSWTKPGDLPSLPYSQ